MTLLWVLLGMFALWMWLRGHRFGGVLATLAFVPLAAFLSVAFYPPAVRAPVTVQAAAGAVGPPPGWQLSPNDAEIGGTVKASKPDPFAGWQRVPDPAIQESYEHRPIGFLVLAGAIAVAAGAAWLPCLVRRRRARSKRGVTLTTP